MEFEPKLDRQHLGKCVYLQVILLAPSKLSMDNGYQLVIQDVAKWANRLNVTKHLIV